jgi:hypothetical protein
MRQIFGPAQRSDRDGPGRLWSLWDLMERFNVFRYSMRIADLEWNHSSMADAVNRFGGGAIVPPGILAMVKGSIEAVKGYAQEQNSTGVSKRQCWR